jgi:P2-related tail formation protein
MANLLASSIKNKAHLAAFDDMMKQRFSELDLSILIPNLFDTVPAEALPYLARQYDVLGYKGWRFADTEQKQRMLLKNSIELHKYKGTTWSIKEALKIIGLDPVEVRVGQYALTCNGEQFCNGGFSCGGKNPFTLQVSLDGTIHPDVSEQVAADMIALIMEYKAGRSLLTSVNVSDTQSEHLGVSDSLSITLHDAQGVVTYVL